MKERTRAITVLIAVLILGCLIGAVGSRIYYAKYDRATTDAVRGDFPFPQPRRERLPELLEMSSEQEARFEEIMAESRERLDALGKEQLPKIGTVIEETNEEIQSLLSDEQKAKLKAFLTDVERQRNERQRDQGPRGPRGDRGPRGERGFGPPPPPQHRE